VKPRLLVALLVLSGCLPQREERCAELNDELALCFGEAHQPIDCGLMSEADLTNLRDALRLLDCAALSTAQPIDGDLLAAGCRNLGYGCVEAINPLPQGPPARHPLILVNGIDNSPLFRYSQRIVAVLRGRGHQVHLAVDTPYDTPRRRALVLWQTVQRVIAGSGAEKVNLICHSLGGLDCRYLVSAGGAHWELFEEHAEIVARIASVTTVATAHRGTRAADVALGGLTEDERQDALVELATFFAEAASGRKLEEDVQLRGALVALTTAEAAAFNAEVVDAPGVYYQSWAGASLIEGRAPAGHQALLEELCATEDGGGLGYFRHEPDRLALPLAGLAALVGEDDPEHPGDYVPNDGLVPVSSARWGNFRGCVPADHMEQLGQHNLPDANVRTGFDVAHFYAQIAADLAERGL
jgi:triacylglycerol lipase